ncbi:AAA family ATPase, partial [Oleiphilus sp. HI0043]|uniref:AAA family ATPase n=5 Tax=Oleiphilus TaxID=141450 RepID=UPI000B141105
YSHALFKQRCNIISAFAERPYHHVFLCEPDFPLVQDGTRKDEDFRFWQHSWYLEELTKCNVAFEILGGSLESRMNRVIELLPE